MRRLAPFAIFAGMSFAAISAPVFTDITPPPEPNRAPSIRHVAVHPLDPDRLLVLTDSGVRLSRDAGATWTAPAVQPPLSRTERLFVHKGRPGTVFAQIEGSRSIRIPNSHRGGELYRSTDFGESWPVTTGGYRANDDLILSPFASSPEAPEILLATYRTPLVGYVFHYETGTDVGFLFSRDGGSTWRELSSMGTRPGPMHAFGQVRYGIIDVEGPVPAAPHRLFFTTADFGAFASNDDGMTWKRFPATLDTRLFQVRQHPQDPAVLYAIGTLPDGLNGGVLRSNDGGESWELAFALPVQGSAAGPMIHEGHLALDPAQPRRLWLTHLEKGVFLSEDGGTSWTSVGFAAEYARNGPYDTSPLVPRMDTIVRTLVTSPADSSQVYLVWKDRLYRGSLEPRRRVAVEYQYGDRYWLTGDTAEALSQDYRANEAVRTGQRFGLWSRLDAPQAARAMCRFQGRPSHGQSSRFLAVDGFECDVVKGIPQFVLEGEGEYFAVPPSESGACAAGLVPVRRFNNLQANVNHRYVADPAVAEQMRAAGWYDEGVRMCARPLGSNE